MPNIYDIVTKEFILSKVSEEDIFQKYLGIYPELSHSYINPLRNDQNAGCRFYVSPTNKMLIFKDYSMKWNWDCFNVVEYLYSCSFKKALLVIANDFNLLKSNTDEQYNIPIVKRKPRKIIQVEYRVKREVFDTNDLEFWGQWGIDEETLHLYNVSRAQKVWMIKDGIKSLVSTYQKNFPSYVYHFGAYEYKFYYPTRKITKFIQTNGSIIQGWEQLPEKGEYVVITKSLKDVMCMYTFGIPAIAPMSETIYTSIEKALPELYLRFNHVFVLMDWDRAGKLFSKYFRDKHDLKILSFKSRKPKDFCDHYKHYGLSYMIDLIDYVKTEYEIN